MEMENSKEKALFDGAECFDLNRNFIELDSRNQKNYRVHPGALEDDASQEDRKRIFDHSENINSLRMVKKRLQEDDGVDYEEQMFDDGGGEEEDEYDDDDDDDDQNGGGQKDQELFSSFISLIQYFFPSFTFTLVTVSILLLFTLFHEELGLSPYIRHFSSHILPNLYPFQLFYRNCLPLSWRTPLANYFNFELGSKLFS